MTNPLNQVNEAIIKDPHDGSVARHASHWLAVEVMGWKLIIDPLGDMVYEYFIETRGYLKYQGKEGAKEVYTVENKVVAYMPVQYWQPFTDANHTWMLVRKVGIVCGEYLRHPNASERLAPYGNDPTHDARAVLKLLHTLSKFENRTLKLTNDTLKGWLENA
jgi:hypothetical protein